MIMNAYLVRKCSYTPAQRLRTTMVLDSQRMGDERDWVLVGFFVTCSSSAEKRFIRPAKQDEMGLWTRRLCKIGRLAGTLRLQLTDISNSGTKDAHAPLICRAFAGHFQTRLAARVALNKRRICGPTLSINDVSCGGMAVRVSSLHGAL